MGLRENDRMAPYLATVTLGRFDVTISKLGDGTPSYVAVDPRLARGQILSKLPGSRELAMPYAGVDPIFAPIPVRPGAHYHMGGVETDEWGRTPLEGRTRDSGRSTQRE